MYNFFSFEKTFCRNNTFKLALFNKSSLKRPILAEYINIHSHTIITRPLSDESKTALQHISFHPVYK